jgi:crotonobetainyl-CoA:carnitine CoA-transferase CaiB-like acyl-CoA transferase
MILGDLGADVIKIERPDTGDDTRHWRPPSWHEHSTIFLALNRNKRSLAVDIDRPEGNAVVRRLAQASDVVVESFRPGSLSRRGFGYEQVSRDHPAVIFCSITGFGTKGPQRDRPGYDPVIQAYSGIMSITGEDGRPPVRVGPSIVDMGAGLWSALGILAALYERERTGRGCQIDTSLLEVGVAWVGYQIVAYLGSGKIPGRIGSQVAMIAPYEAFAAQDEYLFVSAPNDKIFGRLCEAMELHELLQDDRFRTNPDRVLNREALHKALEERLQTSGHVSGKNFSSQWRFPAAGFGRSIRSFQIREFRHWGC